HQVAQRLGREDERVDVELLEILRRLLLQRLGAPVGKGHADRVGARRVRRQIAAAVRCADLQPGEPVERALEDQVRERDRRLERIADGVLEPAAASQPSASFSFWIRISSRATSRSALYQYGLMLSASTSMPCSSIARIRSAGCDMSNVCGSTLRPIRAIASGTAQCACTSTVLTRRPLTTTSRRRPCACTGATPVRLHATKAMPAAPAAPSTNSRRVLMVSSKTRAGYHTRRGDRRPSVRPGSGSARP